MLQNIFLKKNDYSYALFFDHLAVEKIIKAVLVKNTNQQVPRSHNFIIEQPVRFFTKFVSQWQALSSYQEG